MNTTLPTNHKPSVQGGWHGPSALSMAGKCCLSFLIMTLLSSVCVIIIPASVLWLKILISLMIVSTCAMLQYRSGETKGERECAWGETVYAKQQKGKKLPENDIDRCFHPLKGYFSAFIGILPLFLVCLVFALLTQRVTYQVTALPSWVNNLMVQSEFSDALSYYTNTEPMSFIQILRVVVRAMLLPYFNVFSSMGNDVLLIIERISPLLILLVPLFYAIGYAQGQKVRDKVNQSIRIGVAKKLKKQQREHKKRFNQPKKPEQLV